MNIRATLHAAAFLLSVGSGMASAQEPAPAAGRDITVFGGVMTKGDFPGDAMIPFGSELDDVYMLGAAYNQEFAYLGAGFRLGGEVGLAGRFGDGESGELWFGPSLRYDGFEVGPLTISAGFVGGVSFVTESHGFEGDNERWSGGDAGVVYYLGPEIGFKLDSIPNTELVYRTHHRSGSKNYSSLPTLGDIAEASNSNLLGLRFRF